MYIYVYVCRICVYILTIMKQKQTEMRILAGGFLSSAREKKIHQDKNPVKLIIRDGSMRGILHCIEISVHICLASLILY